MEDIDIQDYLDGKELFGDDFTPEMVDQWFAAETEGYADLGSGEHINYKYEYNALNILHNFRHLKKKMYNRVLGFGAAFGHEFEPIRNKVTEIHIIEPSRKLFSVELFGKKVNYQVPVPSGKLNYPDDYFDLITCFGTLHHIANVSAVVKELSRTLKPGGCLLLREPIISMGDWRYPREGLTAHERGIPYNILRSIVTDAGLKIFIFLFHNP